jgi:glycosyltransferase involved in cell wall biosynthesis
MKIALIGTRGVPSSYGGFETCAEQLGARLVQRGHEVTVYCRSHHITYPHRIYRGMRLIKLPTIRNKYLDTIVHTFISSLHALAQPYDICLYFIVGNSVVSWLPRIAGKRTILNVDGLDWQREKWPGPAKHYIRFAERMATVLPNEAVTDSSIVQKYYLDRYGASVHHIAYGSEVAPLPPGDELRKWGLEPGKYILFVGRLVPENRVDHLLDAFSMLENRMGMKCVIVGDSVYDDEYVAQLKAKKNEEIVFTGYVFGDGYRELSANAYCFVEPTGVGGTHPALLEAMGFGSCVVANDIAENLETMGAAGFSYPGKQGAKGLWEVLQHLLDNPQLVLERRRMSLAHAQENYTWDLTTARYIALFESTLTRRGRPRRMKKQYRTGADTTD